MDGPKKLKTTGQTNWQGGGIGCLPTIRIFDAFHRNRLYSLSMLYHEFNNFSNHHPFYIQMFDLIVEHLNENYINLLKIKLFILKKKQLICHLYSKLLWFIITIFLYDIHHFICSQLETIILEIQERAWLCMSGFWCPIICNAISLPKNK